MTVADNTSRNQYTATSGQTVFAYTFEIVDKDHIVVLKNGVALSEGTDYSVSNVGNDNGGNITLTVGATTGDVLTLYRDMPYSRTQNYTNSGDFLASEVNSDFDELWLAGEQTDRAFSQSIRKPITDSDSISMELPVAADRANKFVKFDANGAVDVASSTPTVTADAVTITDTGNYYTSNDVEGALQEVGADLTANTAKLAGIEAGADVTDTANVTAAGALMDSEVTNLDQVKAFDQTDYATAAQGTTADAALPRAGGAMTGPITTNSTFDGRDVATDGTKLDGIEAGATTDQTAAEIKTAYESNLNTNAFTDADESKLDGIEELADVTDTTNVVASLTAGSNITISAGGVIASTASGGSETLAQTLVLGNTTGGTDLSVSSGDNIVMAASSTVDGRDVSVDGAKLDGIEAGADVTDTANVTAAGALMDSEVTNLAQVKAFDSADYATAAQGTTADNALPKTGGAMTGAITTNSTFDGRDVATDGIKLDGIEASADVTDTANVTAAGALMDSELASEASVKALNQGVATTDSPSFAGATISSISYPTTDGSNGQVITTDGSGTLTFSTAGSSLTDVSVDSFTGTGTQTAFTLSVDPGSENNLQVYVDGVYQNKDTFSISGTTLTFSEAPPLNGDIEACTINETGTINVPADASVTSAKLSGNLTTPGNLDVTGSVTADGGYFTNNVGIGTSAPSEKLTLNNGSFRLSDGYAVGWGDNTTRIAANSSSDFIQLITSNTEQMGISSTGAINVYGDSINSYTASSYFLRNRVNGGSLNLGVETTAGALYYPVVMNGTSNILVFNNASGEMARFDTSGNFGIGTTAPTHKLSVFEDSDGNRTEIGIDNTDQRLVLGAYFEAGVAQYSTIQSTNNAETGSQNLLLQPDGGNVGIGTSPSSLLDVANGTAYSTSGDFLAAIQQNGNATGKNGLSVMNAWGATDSKIFEAAMGWNGASTGYYPVFTIDGLGQVICQDENGSGRFKINSSGNVGINNSNPDTSLHIGDISATNATGQGRIKLEDTSGSLANTGGLEFVTSAFASGYGWKVNSIDAGGGVHLAFGTRQNSTTWSEKLRIDASGNLMVGQSSVGVGTAGGTMYSTGQAKFTADGTTTMYVSRLTSDGTIIDFRKGSTSVGSISVTASATSYNESSDVRLKENIVDAPSASDEIDAIQVRSFDWKVDGSHRKYGMIAQELQSVAPEAVTEGDTETDMMGVDYSKLVPMLVKEIQSLRARVAQLEND